MTVPRTAFAYVTTPRGKALAMGGYDTNGQMLNSSDEYNRTLEYWLPSTNAMQEARVELEVSSQSSFLSEWTSRLVSQFSTIQNISYFSRDVQS